jgi:copper chaperone CopZ
MSKSKNKQNIYKIFGMDCPSCAMLIESELEDAGINVKVSYAKETLEFKEESNIEKTTKIITQLGYKLENFQ